MLLKKYDENRHALMQIGREALAEMRKLGIPLTNRDLENERKDLEERQNDYGVADIPGAR